MSEPSDTSDARAPAPTPREPIARGAALRRELALKLPVPDLARDAGGALVVDIAALELGADEIAGPLADVIDITAASAGSPAGPPR
jgi:hypothetical protein